jgi:hypothetical protein
MKLYLLLGACAFVAACSPPKASEDAPAESLSAAAPAAARSSEVSVAELPAAFLGVWDADPACPSTSDTRLTVSAAELTFFESGAMIKKVTVKSPDEAIVDADFSGEGETWSRSVHLKLGDDGKTLTSDEGTDKAVTRTRCKA